MTIQPGSLHISRQQRRSGHTRQRLLEAARIIFAEKGLDSARISEITEKADLGKGTFYYHFRTKEELIRELIQITVGDLQRNLLRQCSGIDNLSDLLDAIIQTHLDFFGNRWEDFVLYFQGRADLTLQQGYEGIATPFLEYLNTIEKLLGTVIKYHLPKTLLSRLTCAVAGFVSGYYSFAFISSRGPDSAQTFQAMRCCLVTSLVGFIRASQPSGSPDKKTRQHLKRPDKNKTSKPSRTETDIQ